MSTFGRTYPYAYRDPREQDGAIEALASIGRPPAPVGPDETERAVQALSSPDPADPAAPANPHPPPAEADALAAVDGALSALAEKSGEAQGAAAAADKKAADLAQAAELQTGSSADALAATGRGMKGEEEPLELKAPLLKEAPAEPPLPSSLVGMAGPKDAAVATPGGVSLKEEPNFFAAKDPPKKIELRGADPHPASVPGADGAPELNGWAIAADMALTGGQNVGQIIGLYQQ